MSYSISATPAAAATSTTQQPSQSSDVTTTNDSVDTRLSDERATLREKGNLNSSQPQDSLVLHSRCLDIFTA
jgi:K+-transporting ATPase c subunit